jgi:NAD(P)-dependent dehydrogenase (short-subunit alcohol dehydrogenase family)
MAIDKVENQRKSVWPEPGFLTGRRALVTGGARRMGRHMARALAEQGADIALHYNFSEFEAHATADELKNRGARVVLLQADLEDSFLAEDLICRAADALEQPVDILINNASLFAAGSALETDVEEWDSFQDVNLRAPYLMARALADGLDDDGRGDVINLNDFRAMRPATRNFAYTLSKQGLHGLTRSLALSLAPRVRVNELALGAVLPPKKGSQEYEHTNREEIPIGRFVTPAEVCTAMLFLLANEAMTGQTLFLDGGQNLKD